MSNFELFEQLDYERNCSERISPRRVRNNKLLPPECQPTLSSSCGERVSPRREKGIDCLDFFGSQQPVNSPTQRQSSSSGTTRFTVTARNNGNSNGRGSQNGSPTGSVAPQTLLTERVTVTETGFVPSINQDAERLRQETERLRREEQELLARQRSLLEQRERERELRRQRERAQQDQQLRFEQQFLQRQQPSQPSQSRDASIGQDLARLGGVAVIDEQTVLTGQTSPSQQTSDKLALERKIESETAQLKEMVQVNRQSRKTASSLTEDISSLTSASRILRDSFGVPLPVTRASEYDPFKNARYRIEAISNEEDIRIEVGVETIIPRIQILDHNVQIALSQSPDGTTKYDPYQIINEELLSLRRVFLAGPGNAVRDGADTEAILKLSQTICQDIYRYLRTYTDIDPEDMSRFLFPCNKIEEYKKALRSFYKLTDSLDGYLILLENFFFDLASAQTQDRVNRIRRDFGIQRADFVFSFKQSLAQFESSVQVAENSTVVDWQKAQFRKLLASHNIGFIADSLDIMTDALKFETLPLKRTLDEIKRLHEKR